MAGILDKAIAYSVGLLLLFLLASTLILPNFSKAWRFCQAKQWNPDDGGLLGANCTTPYTNANTSAVTGTPHTEDGETVPAEVDIDPYESIDVYCLNCETLGGYRTTVQGLVLLALALALIGFAMIFLPKKKVGL